MTNEYRLVCQYHQRSWGSEGLEWNERYYVLQTREVGHRQWHTVPTVDHSELSPIEQEEILIAHGYVKNEHGYWSPKEGQRSL